MQLPDYTFASQYHDVIGGRMHYVDEGEGPVVVMVHGNPTWSYFYRHLIETLRHSHRVIAIDHLGCGLSDKPANYSYRLADHIANLESLLDALQIRRFRLVLHDWGGAIGMGCAVKRPADVDRIVVMNTAAYRSKRIPGRIQLCRIPVIGEIIVRLFNGFAWPAQFMAVAQPMATEVAKAYLYPYDSWKNRVAIHRFVRDIPLSENDISYGQLHQIENGLAELRRREIPLMVLWGGQDFCFTRHFYKEWLQRFPAARCRYFSDAGHYLLEDKREVVCQAVMEFFS